MRPRERRQLHARCQLLERLDELGGAALEGVVEDHRGDDRLGARHDDLERDRLVRHDPFLHEPHRLLRELDRLGPRLISEDELLGTLDGAGVGHLEGDVDDDGERTSRTEHRREQFVIRRQHADLAFGGHHGHLHGTLAEQTEPPGEVATQPTVEGVPGHADAGTGAHRQRAAVGLDRLDEFAKDHSGPHRDQSLVVGRLEIDRLEADRGRGSPHRGPRRAPRPTTRVHRIRRRSGWSLEATSRWRRSPRQMPETRSVWPGW